MPKHDHLNEKHPTLYAPTLLDALQEAVPGATYVTGDGFTVTLGTKFIHPAWMPEKPRP